ncbi:hypothetical protein BD770DRAFT_401877, partial [Pilaira anomala]
MRRHYQTHVEYTVSFQPSTIKRFWDCSMYPQARTLLYRVFHSRIPTNVILAQFNIVPSHLCSWCKAAPDTTDHFLVQCPLKWKVWHNVLSQYYPHLKFSTNDVLQAIQKLQAPYLV